MSNTRLVMFVLLGEALVGIAGVIWIQLRHLTIHFGDPHTAVSYGILTAAALASVNLGLIRYAPDIPGVRELRQLYSDLFRPVFGTVGPLGIAVISLMAGVGEEVLFRGAIQTEWGVVPASVLFGLVHIGGSGTLALGISAAVIGVVLGWLATTSGGLLAAIVAHAAYDALALAYIRWVPAESNSFL